MFITNYAGTAILTGCYKVPNAYANVKGVFTNTNPVDAYRGAGRPEAAYLIERLIDKSAKDLNICPLYLRNVNLIDESDMPYKTALGHTYDSGNFKKNLLSCVEISQYNTFQDRKSVSLKNNKYRGIGISTCSKSSALQIALMTAGGAPIAPASPAPFIPRGFVLHRISL